MDEQKNGLDELREAYEQDKERRNLREDELQAAKDYLGVLLKEIEEKNKELDEKRIEAGKLADALKKSETEKQAEAEATAEAKEVGRYKSIWIGIAIIEFLAIIAVVVSLFIVYGKVKSDYEAQIAELKNNDTVSVAPVTEVVTPTPATARYIEDLSVKVAGLSWKLKDGFSCGVETYDNLEYLVFQKGDFKIGYKNEYYIGENSFKKAVLLEKGDKRIFERVDYDLEAEFDNLCPFMCRINGNNLAVITDYTGFGNMPSRFRLVDVSNLTVYYGDDIKEKIGSLFKASFSDKPTGLTENPILLELITSKAQYKYGLTDSGFNEMGYVISETDSKDVEIADITSEFRFIFEEEGISWATVVKLGRNYYLGELKGELALGLGSVVVNNAKYGAYAQANVEDPDMFGVIIPAESIPERYVTIGGNNSERYYIAINDNIQECQYDWERLYTDDPNNWVYIDENGNKASVRGIDVSKYQGNIDWKKVSEAGVEFAIIRLGYRGMNEGTLEMDPYFEKNIKGASDNGIDVGVYFFSQAITKEEAVEEAEFVLTAISAYDVTYPIVFDTEKVTTFDARANGLSVADRTDICIAFCDRVGREGYTPMFYANTKYMIMGLDLERLQKYDRWYAVYSDSITFPYNFQMLQYSDKGTIPGITGGVDLDISFVDYSKADDKNE
ncbi:MAG: hypothetical protein IKW90_04360 [Lachnospiraceae bacterium]|nr:hypothetical protein [Lachnospiraceae bacterium]